MGNVVQVANRLTCGLSDSSAICPEADPAKIEELKKLRDGTDPSQLAKRIEQKLERIYQMANHRISPSAQATEPKIQPLTRIEKQTLDKLSKIFGIQVYVGATPQ